MSRPKEPPTPLEIAQSMKTMRENLPALLEMMDFRAQIQRRYYLALVKQGFTEAQALQLSQNQQVIS